MVQQSKSKTKCNLFFGTSKNFLDEYIMAIYLSLGKYQILLFPLPYSSKLYPRHWIPQNIYGKIWYITFTTLLAKQQKSIALRQFVVHGE